jgi:hypothetical protein
MSSGQAATLPNACGIGSTWVLQGTVWKPTLPVPTVANCTLAIHFINGGHLINGTHNFIVRHPDPKDPNHSPTPVPGVLAVVDGLDDNEDVPSLKRKFPGAIQFDPHDSTKFTLPLVRSGSPPIDITLPPP